MNSNSKPFTLSYAHFCFTMEALEDSVLPPYLGSTLRGALGHALRQLVCIFPRGDCKKCMHRWQCAFTYIMATSRQETDSEGNIRSVAVSHPYVIEPPEEQHTHYQKGILLQYRVLLVGNSISLLPLFIAAFMRVGKNGLGRNRHKFILQRVEQEHGGENILLWQGGDNLLQPPLPIEIGEQEAVETERITVILHTPTRLVDKGRLDDSPDFSVFMRAVFRRLDSLGQIHGKGGLELNFQDYINKADQVQLMESNCSWFDWERYSSRQSAYMKLGGLVGKLTYGGDLSKFIPYLKMGQILHVGKNTSFGLGRYTLVLD